MVREIDKGGSVQAPSRRGAPGKGLVPAIVIAGFATGMALASMTVVSLPGDATVQMPAPAGAVARPGSHPRSSVATATLTGLQAARPAWTRADG